MQYQVIIQSRVINGLFYLAFKPQLGPLSLHIQVFDMLEAWEVGQLLGGN